MPSQKNPIGTIRPVRIICIGAGASGINLAYQVQRHMKKTDLVIYEKNPAIGGTWYENRYPGCKCDIPSHNYQFAWEPNPDWQEMFSIHHKIRAYLNHCVSKYDLRKYICLNHRMVGATWNEEGGIWHLQIEDTVNQLIFDNCCHFLINAGGILNNWKWPDIPGLHEFKGKLIHSANWPEDWDYKGLSVAVIGNSSTGIQIVPSMQPHVKELIHLIRSPTWVTPGATSRYPSLRGGKMPDRFSDKQREHFHNDPELYLAFRKQVEKEINSKFQMLVNSSQKAEEVKNTYNSMIKLLREGSAKYADKIITDFPVGCRCITPGIGYLESFSKSNVRMITEAKIERVDADSLTMSGGEHIKTDAIVCATGFDDFRSEPNIPYAYLSTAVPKFPNYFTQKEGIEAYDVKQAACDDFLTHIQHFMPRTAWAANCRSWFKNGRFTGPVLAIHPGSRIHRFHALERPKFEGFRLHISGGESVPVSREWVLDEGDRGRRYVVFGGS
ncbi:hypothetical protein VTN00DRAFT_696 [Thermoascus crustaceus]|uniref:uncharacterized protein n=1 Tax=Thermoascus crustaceus TaxID=5088 RepID=UPI0037436DE0